MRERFQRLAADGITPKNTVFVLSSDEGDHEAGGNVGRAVAPPLFETMVVLGKDRVIERLCRALPHISAR